MGVAVAEAGLIILHVMSGKQSSRKGTRELRSRGCDRGNVENSHPVRKGRGQGWAPQNLEKIPTLSAKDADKDEAPSKPRENSYPVRKGRGQRRGTLDTSRKFPPCPQRTRTRMGHPQAAYFA